MLVLSRRAEYAFDVAVERPHHADPRHYLRAVTASMQATAKFLDDRPQVVGVLFDDPQGFL